MAFGNTPKDVTLIPLGSVAVPNHTGGDLTALEGGPASTDTNGNETAPASMYVKDGGNVAQGSLADAAWSGSGNGSNIAILKKIVAGQAGPASVTQGAGAAAGTFWRVAGDFSEQASLSAGALNADLVPATDVSGFKFWSLQIATVATGGSLSFQYSNDNVIYNILQGLRLDTFAAGNTGGSTSTANTLFGGPIAFRYLRVRQTSWTSGSSTGTLELYTVPPPYPFQSIKMNDGSGNALTSSNTALNVSPGPPADLILFASTARTTLQTTSDQTNFVGKGLRVVLDVTAAGTGSVTLTINAKDVASGKYVLLLAGAAVTTISTNVYVIHPELTAAANSIAKDILPHTWQVVVTANNANSMTYSVGASYLS